MGVPSRYIDVPGPRGRNIRIEESEVEALRVTLLKGRPLDERQYVVLRCLVAHWRASAVWVDPPVQRHHKRGLGLRPLTTVLLQGGPLGGGRGEMEEPDRLLCANHDVILRLDERTWERARTLADCQPYLRDPYAHPRDSRINYRFAPERLEELHASCAHWTAHHKG